MLDCTQNDLLARPTMLDNAVEPRMLLHGNFGGVTPQLFDKLIGIHELGSSSAPVECPHNKRNIAHVQVAPDLMPDRLRRVSFAATNNSGFRLTMLLRHVLEDVT